LIRCGDVGEVQSTVGERKRVEYVELRNLSIIELLSTVENTLVLIFLYKGGNLLLTNLIAWNC
jgi:hypothetical protein